jgi:cation transport regulator
MRYGVLEGLAESQDDGLARRAREIYEELYNSAWAQYEDSGTRLDNSSREETAHRFAWTALGELYRKNSSTGEWCRVS